MTKYLAALVCSAWLAGACGDGSPAADAPPDVSLHTYAPNDPNIFASGRVNTSDSSKTRYSINGVTFTAQFQGTDASVVLQDELRYGKYRNTYDVVVDGVTSSMDIQPDWTGVQTVYPIATGLAYGPHEVTVIKRTEPTVGTGWFLGFQFAGTILPPPAPPAHKIEIIGDSITAGAGLEALNNAPACTAAPDGWGLGVENVHKAYGPVLAGLLDAEYHVLGVSGIGLVRDYSSNTADDLRTMPEVYDLLYPELPADSSNVWDTTQWTPDAIVIGLGTNDFSPGDNTADNPRPKMDIPTFVAAYVAFIHTLRGYYPDAQIFPISSPLLGDGYPDATYTSATDLVTSVAMIEAQLTAAGDTKVHKFDVTHVNGNGCGTHPDATQQAYTANQVAPFIKPIMGW
jgi:lysophospholipase L1-like esterase